MSGIDRRDFLNGVALSIAGAASGTGLTEKARAATAADFLIRDPFAPSYPPALYGMRGDHAGSYEIAHSMSWNGIKYGRAEEQVDEPYDLVVVGGGLSGLAAAHDFQKKAGGKKGRQNKRILILDNHDDFGGHAKRNEFYVDGHHMIGYGGSQSIDTPSSYSPEAKGLLKDLGIEVKRFYDYYDRDFNKRHGLGVGVYFDRGHYGVDKITGAPEWIFGALGLSMGFDAAPLSVIEDMPLSKEAKRSLRLLLEDRKDHLAGRSRDAKIAILNSISYSDYLRRHVGVSEEAITFLNRSLAPLEALTWETVPASSAAELVMPGTLGLGLEGAKILSFLSGSKNVLPRGLWGNVKDKVMGAAGAEPYIFHFPDGNAGIARLLIRKMIPNAAPGRTMEDIVRAPMNYHELDRETNAVRMRLNSTVVDVRHTGDRKAVEVSYACKGELKRVVARHVILACHHKIIPFICEEVPEEQREALDQADRAPLAYVNVALRNWRAFAKAGVSYIYSPQAMFSSMALDFPVSMGGVQFASSPDDPMLLHISYTPAAHVAPAGRPPREIFKEGRHWLYVMSYDDFEKSLRNQLDAMLGPYGFRSEQDVAAVTVNRWPHGYAYFPMSLWDTYDATDPRSPNQRARKQLGRISFANSDAEYKAYVNGAFDAAFRAVDEQLS